MHHRVVLWCWGVVLLLAVVGVAEADPAYCVRWDTNTSQCRCRDVNCHVCHSCGCDTIKVWSSCSWDSCGRCWCSPVCKCCYTSDCGSQCCQTHCDTCTTDVCGEYINYTVTSLEPRTGPVTGGTTVLVNGGTFANSHRIKCKFGQAVVDGDFISATRVRCSSPEGPTMSTSTRSVVLEVSLDGGLNFTDASQTFTYYKCPGATANSSCSGHGTCNTDGTCTCAYGYWGQDCSNTCPGGVAAPCSLHAVASQTANGCGSDGTCVCQAGYYGVDCGHECPGGVNNTCSGRGECTEDGVCVCVDGFVGDMCQYTGDCDNTTNTCRCRTRGRWGNNCEHICPGGLTHPCSDHGVCDIQGKCFCDAGYWGDNCQNECPGGAIKRCSLHSSLPNNTCTSNGTCPCSTGFWSADCSQQCPTSDTSVPPLPCTGHGRCNAEGTCTCDPGYVGLTCAIECKGRVGDQVCHGRGECHPELHGTCSCNLGFYGDGCEGVCPGTVTACSGHGVCTDDGVCVCSGYFGADCSQPCPGLLTSGTACSNHGLCVANGTCTCLPGYYGTDCSHICPGGAHNPCSGNGTCVDGVCYCHPGFGGPSCLLRVCPNNCNGNGLCINGECQCNEGWSGGACSAWAGTIGFAVQSLAITEDAETVDIELRRTGGSAGAITALLSASGLSALQGSGGDFIFSDQSVLWEDGDASSKSVRVDVIHDQLPEEVEVFQVNITRVHGAILGSNSTITVSILANNGTSSIVIVTIRMLYDLRSIPLATTARRNFEEQFRTDVLAALKSTTSGKVARSRIQVAKVIDAGYNGDQQPLIKLQMDIVPDLGSSISVVQISEDFIRLLKDPQSVLYAGTITRFIDISYMPDVEGRPATIEPHTSSSSHTGAIVAGVLVPVLVLFVAGVCYWKRHQITEWLLWKLGNFRFRSLRERRSTREDSVTDDTSEPANDGDDVDLVQGPASDEYGIGHAAEDTMPLDDM